MSCNFAETASPIIDYAGVGNSPFRGRRILNGALRDCPNEQLPIFVGFFLRRVGGFLKFTVEPDLCAISKVDLPPILF